MRDYRVVSQHRVNRVLSLLWLVVDTDRLLAFFMHLRQLKVRKTKDVSLGLLEALYVSHLGFQAFHSELLVLTVV